MPLDDSDTHDLDAMLTEITAATRLVIVCNPNNPTSTALPLDKITAFAAEVPPHVALILDEAYCEFNLLDDPDASIDLLERHPNLVLLRTFSKVYGLAGLRVGFALAGSERFVQAVDQVRQPFFCNAAAQAAAIEALRHQDAVAERVERAVVARVEMQDGLERLGLRVAESQANFCWLHLPGGRSRRRPSSTGSPSAASSSAPERRSAARARCASPTAARRRTRGSSASSPRSWADPAGPLGGLHPLTGI